MMASLLTKNIDSYVKETLLPEMKKIYPEANIKKETIGETIGFEQEEKSDAVDLVCNLTGDNSRGTGFIWNRSWFISRNWYQYSCLWPRFN